MTKDGREREKGETVAAKMYGSRERKISRQPDLPNPPSRDENVTGHGALTFFDIRLNIATEATGDKRIQKRDYYSCKIFSNILLSLSLSLSLSSSVYKIDKELTRNSERNIERKQTRYASHLSSSYYRCIIVFRPLLAGRTLRKNFEIEANDRASLSDRRAEICRRSDNTLETHSDK